VERRRKVGGGRGRKGEKTNGAYAIELSQHWGDKTFLPENICVKN